MVDERIFFQTPNQQNTVDYAREHHRLEPGNPSLRVLAYT